jgi:nickel-type superoxide dismutase maturation protease
MAPRLPSGALIVARSVNRATSLHVGDVVVARRPDRPELQIIKRIQAIDAAGAIVLSGDNPAASTDSRQFGPVTRDHIVARVRWRYWPLPPTRV